jgi:AcrR family transcriptional regulator
MIEKGHRGRPQVRSDERTRRIIIEAARHEFEANGYAATSMEDVAHRAGVSTKTLYRLVPNKARLLKDFASVRFDQLAIKFKLHVPRNAAIEVGLHQALIFCANIALHPEILSLERLILQEILGFPELAASFYTAGIVRITAELSKWLREQVSYGSISIDDCDEAAGFLIGMLVSEPRRESIYSDKPLPSRQQIEERVQSCVALFLNGCRATPRSDYSIRIKTLDERSN